MNERVVPKRRVLLVDDHPVVRQGLALLINQRADLTVCGTATSSAEGFEAATDLLPDIIIVDLSLRNQERSDLEGLRLIGTLRAHFPEASILAFSMHEEALFAERALRAGANGYLMKQAPVDDIFIAIERVLQGGTYVTGIIQPSIPQELL